MSTHKLLTFFFRTSCVHGFESAKLSTWSGHCSGVSWSEIRLLCKFDNSLKIVERLAAKKERL